MLEPLAAIHDDADVIRYIGGRQRWAGGAAAERLAEYMADYRRLGFSKWAIVLKGTGELVGRCGPVVEMIEGISEIELGCTLGPRYWGGGMPPRRWWPPSSNPSGSPRNDGSCRSRTPRTARRSGS